METLDEHNMQPQEDAPVEQEVAAPATVAESSSDHLALALVFAVGASFVYALWSTGPSALESLRGMPDEVITWVRMLEDSHREPARMERVPREQTVDRFAAYTPLPEYPEELSLSLLANRDETRRVPPRQATLLTECGHLLPQTRYVLEGDLDVTRSPCLVVGKDAAGKLSPADNITLDCQGNHVNVRQVSTSTRGPTIFEALAADNLVVENCVFEDRTEVVATSSVPGVEAVSHLYPYIHCFQCTDGLFRNNVVQAYVQFRGADTVDITHNLFVRGHVDVAESKGVFLRHNVFEDNPDEAFHFATHVRLWDVDGVGILGNTFNGGSRFRSALDGVEAAITTVDKTRGINMSDNTFANYSGCGVVFGGTNDRHRVVDNTIDGLGFCGFGGWYFLSMRDSVFARNTLTHVPTLFHFVRAYGLRTFDTGVYFTKNTFTDNTLVDPHDAPRHTPYASLVQFDQIHEELTALGTNPPYDPTTFRYVAGETFETASNTFSGNVFGDSGPVLLMPESLHVDDGTNLWSMCSSTSTCGVKQ